MAVDVTRDYLHVGGRHVHLRRAGVGPTLVMCHPSPGSSFMLEPLIRELGGARMVWALDTPGYGGSDPLEVAEPTAGDYADALAATIEAAGLGGGDLYGAHTGAKIALEMAVRRPELVRRLVLDGLSLYTDEERASHLAHYTPSIEPVADGSHLVRYWQIRRDMHVFFPWYRQVDAARMDRPLPSPEELHAHVVDFLRAGAGYGKGYRAAFTHDTAGALGRLRVPALVLASSRDPVRVHLERIGESPWVTVGAPEPGEDPVRAVAERITVFLDES